MTGLGLFTAEGTPVALHGVRINAHITALGQKTSVEQVFRNTEARPIEALYTFPLPESAAVSAFEVITGDRVLTGVIEELAAGIEQYDKAIAQGHGAFMAEQWRPDVFSTRVGNIKPSQAVLIRLTYVSDIDLVDRKLRLDFPTTLAPRYGTATAMDPVAAAVESDALNPPHVLQVPYGLELHVHIDLGLPVKSVASPTHGIRAEHTQGEDKSHAWQISLAVDRTKMNRNVIIEAQLAKDAGAHAMIETGVDPSESFVSVTFQPDFSEADLDAITPRDILFLLDCSGSMGGASIKHAKRALALSLKSLNEGDHFNICRFGSTFEFMQPEPVLYAQRSLDDALAYIDKIRANLGGTELHAPLHAALASANPPQLRDVILLTDGQVTNEPALVQLAAAHRGRARVFSFGIGPASSEFLIKGIARASGGASEFIAPGEGIEDKVLRMFGRLASPHLDHFQLDWHNAEADSEPREIAALFDGDPLRIAARLHGKMPRDVTLRAVWQGHQKTWTVPITTAATVAASDHLIAATWARRRLATLELAAPADSDTRADERKKTIVALSKRYHILSKETTLLAIEHRSLEERTQGLPAQRRIPVMLPKGWGSDGVLYDSGMVMACMAPAAPAAAGSAVMDHLTEDSMDPSGSLSKSLVSRPADAPGIVNRFRRKLSKSASTPRTPTTHFAVRKSEVPADILHQLLLCQSAEGWFAWDDLLNQDTLAGKSWNRATDKAAIEALLTALPKGVHEKILATALTLRAFQQCFPDQEDQWRLAAQKANRCLAKNAPTVKAWLEKTRTPA